MSRIIRFIIVLIASNFINTIGLFSQEKWTAPASADKFVSPFSDKNAAAEAGKVYFDAICFVCHGNEGRGDGINAPSLERPPANLTSSKVQSQSDGAIFWKISEGNLPMLSFKETLPDETRWQLVAYVRRLGQLYGNSGKGSKTIADNSTSPNLKSTTAKSKESSVTVINPYQGMTENELFKNICGACHTIGKGKMTGPDLKNVSSRHSREWLIKWVQSSQTMVKAGDPEATKLFSEFNQVIMPDQPFLSKPQINSIFDYIELQSKPVIARTVPLTQYNRVSNSQRNTMSNLSFYFIMSGFLFFLVTSFYVISLMFGLIK